MANERDGVIVRLYCKLKQELCVFAARFCPGDAEDIVQQAFINCYDKIAGSRGEDEQRSYLYSSVKNLCHNNMRNSRIIYTDTPPDLMMEFTAIDTYDYIHEFVNRLPRRERVILQLALQGYSTKEIAERLHVEYNTVRHYKKLAYAKIRDALSREI